MSNSTRSRRQFTTEQKVAILKRYCCGARIRLPILCQNQRDLAARNGPATGSVVSEVRERPAVHR
jgi:hypothetical protein